MFLDYFFNRSALAKRVSEMENKMAALDTTVDALTTSVTNLEARVKAHEDQQDATVAALQKAVADLQGSGNVQGAVDKLNALIATVDNFDAAAVVAANPAPVAPEVARANSQKPIQGKVGETPVK